ncbi:MAG: hypothetical protein ACOC5T_08065 [Elusimicrobiota bacterium]
MEGNDLLVLKADRKQYLVVLTLNDYIDMLEKASGEGRGASVDGNREGSDERKVNE